MAQEAQLAAEYSGAKSLFEEKREATARAVEIDRMLREISEEHSEAVQVACWDIPFCRKPGRQKSGKGPIPPSAL